jgi:chemotaxis signal transduction protein
MKKLGTRVNDATRFVLFPLGKKRFAFPAFMVTEFAGQDEPHRFPHTSPLVTGVLLRRGRIVPVADIAPMLVGPEAPQRKFYLIATRATVKGPESTAIPVTGECELADSELLPVQGELPPYVCGLLALQDEIVEVIDLERLMNAEVHA